MKVSFLMPVCNQGNEARETIESARLAMGKLDYEIIVCDEHSLDGSCHDMPKDVLILRSHFREGCSTARNRMAKVATGDVLIWSDPHCRYPAGCFEKLVELALANDAIIQPCAHHNDSTWVRHGGYLAMCKPEDSKGIRVIGARRMIPKYPALYGTVYAVRRDVYDRIDGWPMLPGIWGCSEQAMTLMCWFSKTPIIVEPSIVIVHKVLSRSHFAFHVSRNDPASNAWYVHKAFFPRSFDCFWKPILYKHKTWKNYDTYLARTETERFKRFQKHIGRTRRRTEEDFFREILGVEPPADMIPESPESLYRRRQARRSRGHDYVGVWPRVERAIDWFIKYGVDGHLNGQSILDVGTRDGHALEYYAKYGSTNAIGFDISDNAVAHARKMGRSVSVGDMRNIKHKDNSFDIVSSIHSLEHCPDTKQALAELSRVLKLNGRLFIVVPKQSQTKDVAHCVCFPDSESIRNAVLNTGVMRVLNEAILPLQGGHKEMLIIAEKTRD